MLYEVITIIILTHSNFNTMPKISKLWKSETYGYKNSSSHQSNNHEWN